MFGFGKKKKTSKIGSTEPHVSIGFAPQIAGNEIIAVIAAAIASMESRPGYKLVVRSMRQVPQSSPVWNTVGRLERLNQNLNS